MEPEDVDPRLAAPRFWWRVVRSLVDTYSQGTTIPSAVELPTFYTVDQVAGLIRKCWSTLHGRHPALTTNVKGPFVVLCDDFSKFMDSFEAQVTGADAQEAVYSKITGHFDSFYMAFNLTATKSFFLVPHHYRPWSTGRPQSIVTMPPIARAQLEDLLATISLTDAMHKRKSSILSISEYNVMTTSPGLLGWVLERARGMRPADEKTPWQVRIEGQVAQELDQLGPLIAEALTAMLFGPYIREDVHLGQRLQQKSLGHPQRSEGLCVRLHPAPVHWMAQQFRSVLPGLADASADTERKRAISSVDRASRPYVEALVRAAQLANRVLAEEERLHDALDGGSVDRRKTPGIGSPILDELVAVMSALRLLCRENKAGAQLSDYLVESTAIFPFVVAKTSKHRLKNAPSSNLAEAIDWICKTLKGRECCGHRTCVLRFADRNPAVTPPACQVEVMGGKWTVADPTLLRVTIYQVYGGDDRATVESVKSREAFCESLEGLLSFTDAAVKHHIRVVRVKFVYVAPRLAPETAVCVPGETPVVLDPHRDPAIKRTLSRAPRSTSTALSHLKKRKVEVTCELWFRTVVAAHLTSVVFDLLPDTAATAYPPAGNGTKHV